jgi:hypothetical protein
MRYSRRELLEDLLHRLEDIKFHHTVIEAHANRTASPHLLEAAAALEDAVKALQEEIES